MTTDASPFGLGAILSVVDKEHDQLTPLVAIFGRGIKNMAQVLGSGQAVLEAFAVLLALRYWRATRLLLKADSTVEQEAQ